MNVLLLALLLAGVCAVMSAEAQEASIRVHPEQVLTKKLSRYLTGACIEDVNHEVYGGIYSQMIFGESFQEPASGSGLLGFRAYRGTWELTDGVLKASGEQGPKLVCERPDFADGEIGVAVLLPKGGGNAGLLVKVKNPGNGADNFDGYEISLDTDRQVLAFGRHRHNWEPIREVPCEVPAEKWIALVVRMQGDQLEAVVDGESVLTHREEAFRGAGAFALRYWNQKPSYKDLWVRVDGATTKLPFETAAGAVLNVSEMWQPLVRGSATAKMGIDTAEPWVGRQSQKIEFAEGQGEVGIENKGLNRWGMSFVKGKPYEGTLRVRVSQPTSFWVAMESADGAKTYAESSLRAEPSGWQRIDFKLTPNATDKGGRFAIKLKAPGAISVGYALLQPGEWGRFKGLPVRKDVVDGLVKQGITVLRYGGYMINTNEYRWKKMIGPRDQRPPYKGNWYPYSSNGWGIIDFLATCKAAKFLGIPDFNMGEAPQDMADFMEYVNGPADSPWGKKRVEDGFGEPFGVKIIQLGNEEAVDENYWKKFKPMAEAIWAKDSNVTLVVGDFIYGQQIVDPYHFSGSPVISSLAAHKKILDLATEHNREVWFDVHVNTNSPAEIGDYIGPSTLTAALKKLCPKARFKVAVFELNAGNPGVKRMLANAIVIGKLEQIGDLVPIVTSANCLQPDKQNDNGWNQGLLFLNPSMVWAQPPYYVTQLLSKNYLPRVVAAEAQSPGNALHVTARQSNDGKTLLLQVVNASDQAVTARVDLGSYAPATANASVVEVSGEMNDVNTPDDPARVAPKKREWKHGLPGAPAACTFAPHSFSVVRFE